MCNNAQLEAIANLDIDKPHGSRVFKHVEKLLSPMAWLIFILELSLKNSDKPRGP